MKMHRIQSKLERKTYNDPEYWLAECYLSAKTETQPDRLTMHDTHEMKKVTGGIDIHKKGSLYQAELWENPEELSVGVTAWTCFKLSENIRTDDISEVVEAVGPIIVDEENKFGIEHGYWLYFLPHMKKDLLAEEGMLISGKRHGQWSFYFPDIEVKTAFQISDMDVESEEKEPEKKLTYTTFSWYVHGAEISTFNVFHYIRSLLFPSMGNTGPVFIVTAYLENSPDADLSDLFNQLAKTIPKK